LTQPGWEDAADYFRENNKKYSTSELKVPAVLHPQMVDDAVAPALKSFAELMECLDIVPGILQMPQGTSRPGSSHIRLDSVKLETNMSIRGLEHPVGTDLSPLLKVKLLIL